MPKKLSIVKNYTKDEARALIFSFIHCGEHDKDYLRFKTDDILENQLAAEGYDLSGAIHSLQEDPNKAIAEFENLLHNSTWEIEISPGFIGTLTTNIGGQEFYPTTYQEHGFIRIAYKADFVDACAARDRSIQNSDIGEFYTALAKGISAIEAFINHFMEVHNRFSDSENQLSKKHKKGHFRSLENKLTEIFPKIAPGIVDDRDIGWQTFLELKKMRNQNAAHPKPGEGIKSIYELAEGLNKFRKGIAGLMFMLYRSINYRVPSERIPSIVIRATFYPDVVVIGV